MDKREQELIDKQRSLTNATPIPTTVPSMTDSQVIEALEQERDEAEAAFGEVQIHPAEYMKLLEARDRMDRDPTLKKEYVAHELTDLFKMPPLEIASTITNLITTRTVLELHLVVGQAPRVLFVDNVEEGFIDAGYLEEGKRILAEGKDS